MAGRWVIAAAFGYLVALFAIAAWADRRAAAGRSVIANAWVYTLSLGVYCSAWTYFGSVGRAAEGGLAFLPIYLGPTVAMVLAWTMLRKMVRIARRYRITSIADFIASRYGPSGALAGAVTLLALVGVVPYVALQLKAVASGYALLAGQPGAHAGAFWTDGTFWVALALAGFTIAFGARHLDSAERHEGLVAAIAAESVVKLFAFVAVGAFVVWGLFDGFGDLFARAAAAPGKPAPASTPWLAMMVLAAFSVLLLPRQFQVMVVENVDERHLKRAAWAFPAYLLAINVFVLPIAAGGAVLLGAGSNAETFVLSLPLHGGAHALALIAFIGGFSAASGMVIVEATAVATMVCNDLVLPLLLKRRGVQPMGATLLAIRRAVIVALLLLGYAYFRIAGEAYALVSIGLISFAAVAQFAPALVGGLYWKGGTKAGALAGLGAGALLWAWTLGLPSIAKSGWMDAGFVAHGPWGVGWLRPEQLFGLAGLDPLTHALVWSLGLNTALFVGVSLWRAPGAREAMRALQFVEVFEQGREGHVFWRGRAQVDALRALLARFLGPERAQAALAGQAPGDAARLVQVTETQLAGAIGSASARVMVASVVEEETLDLDDVARVVEEARELRHVNEQLQSLDRLKDDFMSSVTHELRTPLTSIRALAELMRDEPAMEAAQRGQFLGIIVGESERLTRLVNQVLDMAKIESGHAEWRHVEVDLRALARQAADTTAELFRERGALLNLQLPEALPPLQADPDRLLQVLLNLLSNAVKFVPAEGGRVTLAVRAQADGVKVEVLDNGPGVPATERELVFEKFRQGGDARARPQGTGLGLPICRQIVQHFGGRIGVDEAPGGGARFAFWLPWKTTTTEETRP